MDATVYATFAIGGAEYSREDAQMPIDELIEALQEAKAEGATHIVALSGNYRGAQYVHLGRVEVGSDGDL